MAALLCRLGLRRGGGRGCGEALPSKPGRSAHRRAGRSPRCSLPPARTSPCWARLPGGTVGLAALFMRGAGARSLKSKIGFAFPLLFPTGGKSRASCPIQALVKMSSHPWSSCKSQRVTLGQQGFHYDANFNLSPVGICLSLGRSSPHFQGRS